MWCPGYPSMSRSKSCVNDLIDLTGEDEVMLPEVPDEDVMGDAPSPPVNPKSELWSVLNSFQHSPNYGIYLCEHFRDPRRTQIDDYWNEVKEYAVGIHETGCCIGRLNTPVADSAKVQFRALEKLLRSLADRIDRALAC